MDMEKFKTKVANFYNSHKKLVWIGCALLAIILAGVILPALFGSDNQDEEVVSYGQVTRGGLTETIDETGTLEAIPSAALYWQSGGIVDGFDIEVGDTVQEGDILIQLTEGSLDSSILEAQSSLLDAQTELENLQSTNADLYTAAQTLADAEYDLREFKADRDYYNVKGASDEAIEAARDTFYAAQQVTWEKEAAYDALFDLDSDDPEKEAAYEEREAAIEAENKALRDLNYILGSSYDHGIETNFLEYDAALAAVEEARVAYNRYLDQSDEIAAAEAAVQALENTIDTRYIIAPFDGTITAISAVAGDLIAESYDSSDTTEAVKISNLDNLMVEVFISEVDINKVAVGQKAIVTFDAIPNKEYSGYVSSVSESGSEDSNNVVQFSVWVKIEDADEQVKPGFTSVVDIITSEVEDALLVPYDAVVSRDGSYMVVLEDETLVPIEVGATSDLYAEVLGGDIEEGDTVILYGSNDDFGFGMMMMGGPGGGGGSR